MRSVEDGKHWNHSHHQQNRYKIRERGTLCFGKQNLEGISSFRVLGNKLALAVSPKLQK